MKTWNKVIYKYTFWNLTFKYISKNKKKKNIYNIIKNLNFLIFLIKSLLLYYFTTLLLSCSKNKIPLYWFNSFTNKHNKNFYIVKKNYLIFLIKRMNIQQI